MPVTKEFLTIDAVAQALSVSTRTVRRWIKSRQLVAHRVHRVVRIDPADFDAFLRQHRDA
jgi:excisionase family DNA binding protein